MKKYICTALALLMVASIFVGCGCTNRNVSDHPNGAITDPTSIAPTTNPIPTMTTPPDETTRPATEPHRETTVPTHPTGTTGATEHPSATGSVTDSTDGTNSDNARTRGTWPDRHS